VIYKIKKYFEYYWKASNVHNVHSPFIYDFIQDVLDTNKLYGSFNAIEHERRILLTNHNLISTQDFGVGSKTLNSTKREISDIAKSVLSNQKKCRCLFNLVNKFQSKNILELGTSLGISTLYLASANTSSKVTTIEADPNVWKLARVLFERSKVNNIDCINGKFEDVLEPTLQKLKEVDLAYIDGNHSYKATMDNYNLIKKYINKNSIIILDDIYWSEGMTKAWEEIKKDTAVKLSIDIYDYGFLFFNPDLGAKKDCVIIDAKLKPFRIGLLP
jgi:predicted O-methyltransferase YrrM